MLRVCSKKHRVQRCSYKPTGPKRRAPSSCAWRHGYSARTCRMNGRKPKFEATKCCVFREWLVEGSCTAAIGEQAKVHFGQSPTSRPAPSPNGAATGLTSAQHGRCSIEPERPFGRHPAFSAPHRRGGRKDLAAPRHWRLWLAFSFQFQGCAWCEAFLG